MALSFRTDDLSTTVKDGIGQAELTLRDVWEKYIWQPIRDIDFWDVLDILLLTALLYALYLFVKGRRAGKLAIGLGFILAFYVISDLAGLRAIHQLLAGIAPFAIILLAVIFQPELRDALEKLGSTPFGFMNMNKDSRDELAQTVNEVVEAACLVATSEKDGALIVIEGSTALGEYAKGGQQMDALVSHRLLGNIFVDRSPLHDGAVIIRKNRVAAAGCKLPLSSNELVVGGFGTRHRAAVGVTEKSDCVSVVVSEERHVISICHDGEIKSDYNYAADDLRNDLSLKTIQNRLRNDLFLLLTEISYEANSRNEKPKFRMPSIKLSWSLFRRQADQAARMGKDPKKARKAGRAKPVKREEPGEVSEPTTGAATASTTERFSRSRRFDRRTGQGVTVRREESVTEAVASVVDQMATDVAAVTVAGGSVSAHRGTVTGIPTVVADPRTESPLSTRDAPAGRAAAAVQSAASAQMAVGGETVTLTEMGSTEVDPIEGTPTTSDQSDA